MSYAFAACALDQLLAARHITTPAAAMGTAFAKST
jgi:hypothetical protein